MKVAIVVPAFNEQQHIVSVLKEITAAGFPVYVVDDGSTDRTFALSNRSAAHVFRHKVNLGKGAAMKTGATAAFAAGADAVIFMDSDGQHRVSDLAGLVTALEKGCDVVFGTRNLNMGVPLVRFVGNKFASLLIRYFFGIYVSDLLCGFRAITKSAFQKMNWTSLGYGVETEMVILTGKHHLKYCETPVQVVYFDHYKGVTVFDAFHILFNVLAWRIKI